MVHGHLIMEKAIKENRAWREQEIHQKNDRTICFHLEVGDHTIDDGQTIATLSTITWFFPGEVTSSPRGLFTSF